MSTDDDTILFYGHNWHDLDRLITLARFHFLTDAEFNIDEAGINVSRSSYLVKSFRGPALDWASTIVRVPATFASFENFVTACKNHFGVSAETLQTLQRAELERLTYGSDVSAFFAEFDRITLSLGITADESRVVLVREKLPLRLKNLLAEQALVFHDYGTMRQRLITMWALDPHRAITGELKAPARPKCGNCGKKGHNASNCKKPKK